MESEVETYRIAALNRMVEAFGDGLTVQTVADLSARGAVFVEDGNHGENRPRQDEFASSGIAFIRPPDLKDGRVDFENCDRINEAGFKRVRKGIGRPGDIILTHRATVGRIAITNDDAPEVFVTNPGTTVWRSTDPGVLDQKYLYCYMRSPVFMDQLWAQVGNNSTFDYVSLTQQRGLFIAYPSLPEQRAIAEMVNALDEKIELNRRMNATLEAMTRGVFKEWFVEANEEWKPAQLDEHYEVGRGLSYTSASLSDGEGMPLHNLNTVEEGGGYKYRGIKWYTGEFKERHVVVPGDLVVTNVEQGFEYLLIGYGALIPKRFGDRGLFSQDLCRMRPLPSSHLSAIYLYLLLQTPGFHDLVVGYSNGTTVNHLAIDGLRKPAFRVPDRAKHEAFIKLVKPMLERMELNHEENVSLAALRDTLLPKLMRGEVRVKQPHTVAE